LRVSIYYAVFVLGTIFLAPAFGVERPDFDRDIAPLLKTHCVKCHGPAKQEGDLNLSQPASILRGSKSGPIIASHDLEGSLLWQRVADDEMPPEEEPRLTDAEKETLKAWILQGAPGLPQNAQGNTDVEHWSFQLLSKSASPSINNDSRVVDVVDQYVQAKLVEKGLSIGPEADRHTLIRRVSFILTGLPPTLDEIQQFVNDAAPDAYTKMVERYLASSQYGVRWGKYWLDAVGYADSNGYFNADSDRPWAFRYRDYVIRAFNSDLPFNDFLVQQLAGDELVHYGPNFPAMPENIECLVATHFLRNGQDGTSESDGNPDELRVDRYAALESCMQNLATSLLGLTMQCAKCHDHKFEPISQQDYYRLQAVFYPVFPAANEEVWIKPQQRLVNVPLPGEQEQWEQDLKAAEEHVASIRSQLVDWIREHRPHGTIVFEDRFDVANALDKQWTNTAPGDDSPAGKTVVSFGEESTRRALVVDGALQILEGGGDGDSWLSAGVAFDWTPNQVGESIQASFELIDNKLPTDDSANAKPADRIGYLIALHDFDDNSATSSGNVLIDGNPADSTSVYLDYPGADSTSEHKIGRTGYTAGHNYGICITNLGEDKFRVQQIVDGIPEEPAIELTSNDLPDGGFGFEYCCGRSFVVDNVCIETFAVQSETEKLERAEFQTQLQLQQKELEEAAGKRDALQNNQPGTVAIASDVSANPPDTRLLVRGNYAQPGDVMQAAPLSLLSSADERLEVENVQNATTTGRRLAWARWVTNPNSRAAALLARVQVNRIWQQHFGTGIVATPENLGISGAAPSHTELLNWLAAEFVESGWSVKHIHRLILHSATFRQSSLPSTSEPDPTTIDPDNRLLWHYPMRRLDAEAIRDSLLAVSGDLDAAMGGRYLPTKREASGEVVAEESTAGSHRRSIYFQQRRTQVLSLLQVFDAPSIVFNSVRRPRTTMPLQSLALLNSEFIQTRAASLARRLRNEAYDEAGGISLAFQLAYGRVPGDGELAAAHAFLSEQVLEYSGRTDANELAWRDFCQTLLMSNEYLYIE
jgi:hypothetical protein